MAGGRLSAAVVVVVLMFAMLQWNFADAEPVVSGDSCAYAKSLGGASAEAAKNTPACKGAGSLHVATFNSVAGAALLSFLAYFF